MPAAPVPRQNYSTWSNAPFQLNSKPNSSPQRMLQSCKSKKASHPGWEIMLLGPTMDTFEAWADCQANKLTLTRGRERTVQDRPCTLLHGPKGDFWLACHNNAPSAACTKISLWDQWAKYMAYLELCTPFPWSVSIVNTLAWQSARASNVSTIGPNSMISQPGWVAFFDL